MISATRDFTLEQLCRQLEALGNDFLAACDVLSTPKEAEEADVIVDVFNVPEDLLLEFHQKAYPLMKAARRTIGETITLVTHTPEVTQKHFGAVVDMITSTRGKNDVIEQPIVSKIWELTTIAALADLVREL